MNTTATIDQIVNEFIAEQSITQNSSKVYLQYLKNFWLWCSKNNIDKRSLTVVNLVSYRQHVIENYSGKYATSLITVVKIFFKWLETKHYWNNVALSMKLPKQKNEFLKEPLMDQEVISLLGLFQRNTKISRRDYLIFRFMLECGLRCVEVSRINIGDFVTKRNQPCMLIQRKGHTSKDDFINVSELWNDIQVHLSELDSANDDQPVFVSISNYCTGNRLSASSVGNTIKSYFITANVKRPTVTPHSLRHTAAITLIRNGFTIDEIQMFLGHTKSEITKIYTRYANTEIKLNNKPGKFLSEYFKNQNEQV